MEEIVSMIKQYPLETIALALLVSFILWKVLEVSRGSEDLTDLNSGFWHVPPHLTSRFQLGCFIIAEGYLYIEDANERVIADADIRFERIDATTYRLLIKKQDKYSVKDTGLLSGMLYRGSDSTRDNIVLCEKDRRGDVIIAELCRF